MYHSTTTCEMFYQQADNSIAVNSIEKITMARHFMQGESDTVIEEYPLSEGVTQSMSLCDKIMEKHKLNKVKYKSKKTNCYMLHVVV